MVTERNGSYTTRELAAAGGPSVIRVSVVIPVHNAAATLARALESVLAQTHPACEIIVVDDGSTDGSADVAMRTAGSAARVVRQEHGGVASARNAGIAVATGEMVALLDADDWWDHDKLARQVAVLEDHPEVVATASSWQWDPTSRVHQTGGLALATGECGCVLRARGEAVLRFAFAMTASTIAVRREVLQRHRFDHDLVTAEDRDVWVRLVADGPVWFDQAVLTTVAYRADSLSRADTDRDCGCMVEVLDRYAHLAGRRAIRRWQAATYARWAGRLLAEGRPVDASVRARERWRREWWKLQAWWVLAKCRWRARGTGHGSR